MAAILFRQASRQTFPPPACSGRCCVTTVPLRFVRVVSFPLSIDTMLTSAPTAGSGGVSQLVWAGIQFQVPEVTPITPSVSKAYSGGCQVFLWTLDGGWVSRSPIFYFSDAAAEQVSQTYGTLQTRPYPTRSPTGTINTSGIPSGVPVTSPRVYSNFTAHGSSPAQSATAQTAPAQSDNLVQYCESLKLKWMITVTSVVGTATRVYWEGTKTFITKTYTYSNGDGFGGENGDNRVGTYTASPPCVSLLDM